MIFLIKFELKFLFNDEDQGMMKRFFIVFVCLFSFPTFACIIANPTDDANFCPTFKTAATCYCTASGLPAGMCQNMKNLYSRMMVVFGSLQKACEYQHYTSPQDCVDNWNCYLKGGIDSRGKLCNKTQQACE